jgi:hypothetical protein
MTSDHGAACSPNAPEALPSIDDDDDIPAPEGYTRYTPDPSHRGEAMRQRLSSHWLAAEDLEMAGLIKRKVWDRVLRSTLLPSDTIFQTRFHYKIKRKGGKFEKCKVRLVFRGDRGQRRMNLALVILKTLSAAYRTLVVCACFLLSLRNTICVPITWIFLMLLHRANCSTVMAKTERFTFPPRPATLKR